ncbi:hypothetical protein Y1Q_0023514 [Alligator mississippiensis]|uniref:Uncharacterized protein n=1 Tax=Alligator mississippiensis TaxID=8496 RepID=A0A151NPU5_ALLMI|nr:hypothetical protein Y1Q_0023514 [Alligator mississippiensis]
MFPRFFLASSVQRYSIRSVCQMLLMSAESVCTARSQRLQWELSVLSHSRIELVSSSPSSAVSARLTLRSLSLHLLSPRIK